MTRFAYVLLFLPLLLVSCQQQEVEKEVIIEKEIDPSLEPGLIHNVYFWMQDSITTEERAQFETGLKTLETIPSVKRMFIGKPAATENREVVDNSFDYSLQLWFDDIAGQDAYQIHPTHLELVELKDLWTKVVVRDNVGL